MTVLWCIRTNKISRARSFLLQAAWLHTIIIGIYFVIIFIIITTVNRELQS